MFISQRAFHLSMENNGLAFCPALSWANKASYLTSEQTIIHLQMNTWDQAGVVHSNCQELDKLLWDPFASILHYLYISDNQCLYIWMTYMDWNEITASHCKNAIHRKENSRLLRKSTPQNFPNNSYVPKSTSEITRAADASFSCKVSNVCSKLSFLQLVASSYLLGNYDSRHTKVVQQSLISLVWQFALLLNSINQLCFLTLNQRRHLPRDGSRRTLCCELFPVWSLKTPKSNQLSQWAVAGWVWSSSCHQQGHFIYHNDMQCEASACHLWLEMPWHGRLSCARPLEAETQTSHCRKLEMTCLLQSASLGYTPHLLRNMHISVCIGGHSIAIYDPCKPRECIFRTKMHQSCLWCAESSWNLKVICKYEIPSIACGTVE